MTERIIYWDADPVLFWVTDAFALNYYGVLFMTGIFIGYLIVKTIYKREGVPVAQLDSLLVYIILGTLIGARLGHCLFYQPGYFLSHPLEMLLPIEKVEGSYSFAGYRGLASHGGAIGVLLAIVLYCKKYKIKLLWLLDRVAIAVPVTGACIRLGNFMNSEIYGKPTDGSWGIVFIKDDLIPRHPTQLYEAFSYLLVFIILYLFYSIGKTRIKNGQMSGLFLVLLFLARFTIESFKENQQTFEDRMLLNMGQLLSIPFIIAGILLLIRKTGTVSSPLRQEQM